MVKIKMCGLKRECDIDYANEIMPDYIGFVFWRKSSRYVSSETAAELKKHLNPAITAVGVFVDEEPEYIAGLVNDGIIDMIQLHGCEDEDYINVLRGLTDAPIIKAFRVINDEDITASKSCSADYIMFDSGCGSGKTFDHSLIESIERPYFLAGGLTPDNVRSVAQKFHPYAVDASSSLETDGLKDINKMREFSKALGR